MGFLSIFQRNEDVEAKLVEKGFEISDCDLDCGSCTSKFPSSVKFQDDDGSSLWGSTKPFGLHVVVPTGKTDWRHDATGHSGTLSHAVSSWAGRSDKKFPKLGEATNIKVTVSSLSTKGHDLGDEEYCSEKRGDLLLLPLFVWVKNVTIANVGDVLDTVIPAILDSREEQKTELPYKSVPGFPEAQISANGNQSYIFLCSHKTRDKRCGITAPIMKKEMDIYLRDLNLIRDHGDDRPNGVTVAYVNHIGGHKFAANVIIFNKKTGKNIWLARCAPNNVKPIIDECIVADGKVWPNKVRIAQKFNPVEW
ncbi:actin patches distal protein 1 [[Candida] railenensis]|uniref:Actin patches distal protein 1 n=1 Tax=[Candida] railenensis TaxID=45579 RepID=A0A9P0QPR1_9ASCO|nr:actin patches distal protein 1 [[Candida] railenensis]